MKRFIALICVVLLVCGVFTACNYQVIDTNYKFTEAIIYRADGEEKVEIKSWRNFEDGDMVQITLTDGSVYLTHSSNVILICP